MPSMSLGTADNATQKLAALHWLYESDPGLFQPLKERHCTMMASLLCDVLMAVCASTGGVPGTSVLVAAPGTLIYT